MAFKPGAVPRIDAQGHLPDDLLDVLVDDLAALGLGGGEGGGGVAFDPDTLALPLNAKVDFGAVGNDSADDTAALAAAVAAAKAQNRPLHIPAGTYRTTAPVDMRHAGLRVYGASRETTIIKQMTANTPVVQLGRRRQYVSDLQVTYATPATSAQTNANGFEFYKAYWCTYERLLAVNTARGFYEPQVNYNDGDTTVDNHFFSNTCTDWKVIGFAIDGLNFAGFPGADTGNVFTNVYIRNNPSGTRNAYTGRAVSIVRMDEVVFNQLNIEWMLASNNDPIFIETVGGCLINGLHIEQVGSLGFNLGLINNSDGSKVIVNGMTLSNNQIPSGGDHAIFRYFGNAQVILNGLYQHDNTVAGVFALARVSGATAGVATLVANACDLTLFTTMAASEKAAPQQVVREVNGNQLLWFVNGKPYTFGAAAPTTGVWQVGSYVANTTPSAGGPTGWLCTTAGEPGTWTAVTSGGSTGGLSAYGEVPVSGRYYSSVKTGTSLTTIAAVADRLYLTPITLVRPLTINQLGCNVTTAGTGSVRLGIYNTDANGLPTTPRVDGGVATPDASTTGTKTSTVSATIPAGHYLMALTTSGTATFTAGAVSEMFSLAGSPTLTNAPATIAYVTHSQANPLPDLTGASLTYATASVPLAQMRAA